MTTYKELLTETLDIIDGVLRSENKFWKFTNPFYYPMMVALILLVLLILPVLGFMNFGWTAIKNEYFIRYQIYQKDDAFIKNWVDGFEKRYNEYKRHTRNLNVNSIEHYGKKVPNHYRAYLVIKNIQQERLLSAGKTNNK